MAAEQSARVVVQALLRGVQAGPRLGDQPFRPLGPAPPLSGALRVDLVCAQRGVHIADQVGEGMGQGVDTVFGAAVAQGWHHGDVDQDADSAADEDQQDDLPELGDLLQVRGGGDIGGEGEERRGGHLGALRTERGPPADGERHQRHQREGQQLGTAEKAQGRLHRDAHRHGSHIARGLQQ